MNARDIVITLKGHWYGSYGAVCCPAHDDCNPSLLISDGSDGDLRVNCQAGCDWRDVKDALRRRAWLPSSTDTEINVRDGRSRTGYALKIWHESAPAPGTEVECYLRHRAITLPVPPSLRRHPKLKHTPSGLEIPAMVAGIQGPDHRITGIHRTYLLPDGRGKARVANAKMALAPMGRGAVRLGPVQPAIGLAEGIETALSAMELFEIPVWAALGSRLDQVEVPPEVLEVQLFADNGDAGHEAAEKAKNAFTAHGRRVVLRFPPQVFNDWNDALRAVARERAA